LLSRVQEDSKVANHFPTHFLAPDRWKSQSESLSYDRIGSVTRSWSRKLPLTLLLILTLCLPLNQSLTGEAAAETKTVEFSLTDSQYGFWLESRLFGYTFKTGTTEIDERLTCSAWSDSACEEADQLLGELIMRPCISPSDRGCIEAVEVGSNSLSVTSSSMEKLRLLAESPSSPIPAVRFNGKNATDFYDVPAGGGVSVWESERRDPAGAPKRYMAHVLTRYSYFCGDLKRFVGDFVIAGNRECAIATIEFKGSLIPVTLIPKSGECSFFALKDQCIEPGDYTGNEKMALTLRQDKNRTGWLFGRMTDAEFDSSFNRVRIAGSTVFVPPLRAIVEKSEITRNPKLERFLKARFNGQSGRISYEQFLQDPRTIIDRQIYDSWEIFDAFEENLRPVATTASKNPFNVTPKTNSILWNFASAIYDGSDLHPCSADKSKLHGLVVTNAPLYASGPPKFQQGSLDYKVAGVHRNADGSLFRGRYTFVVRSDTARCYYGFSNAPIEAKVEIVSSDGENQVATTTVNERNGFLTLAASGFTFSAPVIKATLTQSSATKKRTSITCKRGSKTVTVATGKKKAKCPAGFTRSK
jgi:hypothetical protein